MKLADKIRKFMYGRYGADELYYFLFKLYIVILIIDLFINSIILEYLELLIVLFTFYRFFSKKIYKRSNENQIFLKLRNKFSKPFKGIVNSFKNKLKNIKDKNYIYKKCHKCGTIIRLPIPDKYGIRHVKCPKCKKRQKVLCLKKEKIEIIRKNKDKGGKKNVLHTNLY